MAGDQAERQTPRGQGGDVAPVTKRARHAAAVDLTGEEDAEVAEDARRPPQGSEMGDISQFVDWRRTCCANEETRRGRTATRWPASPDAWRRPLARGRCWRAIATPSCCSRWSGAWRLCAPRRPRPSIVSERDVVAASEAAQAEDPSPLRARRGPGLQVGFTGAVRVQKLLLRAPGDGRAPAALRLFANAPNLGFDGAEDGSPTQAVDLGGLWRALGGEGDVESEVVLNAPRFQNVTSLTSAADLLPITLAMLTHRRCGG
ncbi:unnamed protein product [Prorocentrum cordatum]|uniref:PITH domain-containing protein n=1 Tax=Prorocentrum cordatum TaxID=2364126 RepID=A0ABN9XVY0_9DINO|nr:unnamed protein product [Polarella glacialis]